jgi:hypothetical protein
VDETEEVARRLVVARGDGSESLELVKEELDEVAEAIEPPVEGALLLSRGVLADDGLDAVRFDEFDELVGVVAGIGKAGSALQVLNQVFGDRCLVLLPRRDLDLKRSALGVDERVDLGRKTSSRTAQSIASDPPFPPDAS